ncbi:MAG: diaminopimelate epimerase [Proteobacteria bacterium]|nr:diaminopimelate epimerase [Pseudomonadota bacterium]
MYHFEKLHGLGNDFMLLDADRQPDDVKLPPRAATIKRWSDRRYGVGFDQLIYLFKKNGRQCYQFFNADGSLAEQCGNGQRAIALYLNKQGYSMPMTIEGSGGSVQLDYQEDDCITTRFEQAYHHEMRQISLLGASVTAYVVDVGNPHCVLMSGDVATESLPEKAALVGAYFDSGVNVEMMQIINDHHVQIRIYERGAGETLACGSGAAAAAIVLRYYFEGGDEVTVSMPGGDLQVSLSQACDKMSLIGPARMVYQGQIYE